MITLGENQYGKSRVRVMKVHRHPGRNELHDWTVELLLQGDFQSCFIDGDNSKILPTHTLKNTVYSLARGPHPARKEEFGNPFAKFFHAGCTGSARRRIHIGFHGWCRADL